MIEVTCDVYREIAVRLLERIGSSEWFNGSVEYETDDVYTRLTLSAIVYRRSETGPEGVTLRPISDVVPVWWEFSTVQQCGEVLNDFSFADLKPYLIKDE